MKKILGYLIVSSISLALLVLIGYGAYIGNEGGIMLVSLLGTLSIFALFAKGMELIDA